MDYFNTATKYVRILMRWVNGSLLCNGMGIAPNSICHSLPSLDYPKIFLVFDRVIYWLVGKSSVWQSLFTCSLMVLEYQEMTLAPGGNAVYVSPV